MSAKKEHRSKQAPALQQHDDQQHDVISLRIADAAPVAVAYDYAPSRFGWLPRGTIVTVPFGQRLVQGIVLGTGTNNIDPVKLKPLDSVAQIAPLAPAFVDFIEC